MRSTPLALIVLLAASMPALAREGQRLRLEPHRFEAADGVSVDAERGELLVPENRAKRDSRTIRLRFVRFRSTSKRPGSPIVYLAGGPGGSGIGAARGSRFPLFMAMREFGDVIALDQRGTGSSEPSLSCSEQYVVAPGEPLDRARAGAAMADAARRCAERLAKEGVDFAGYTTRESAADLEDLRTALGAKKLTLWGISYGTHLALASLKYHGAHIDRLILAGVECLDCTYKAPSDQQELLEEIARLASADPEIRARTPNLLGSIRALLDELAREPKTVVVAHPSVPQPLPLTLGKLDLQVAIAEMLRGPEAFEVLPDFIGRLERGDWTALALLAGRFRFGTAPSMMSVAMDCASGVTAARQQRIAAEARETLLGDAINLPFPELCAGVTIPDLGDDFRKPVRSSVRTLIISGTLDGRTPVRNGEELARTLPKAQHLVIEGAGHSDPLFLSSPKILEAMRSFLRGEPLSTRRIALPAMKFTRPREVKALTDAQLERVVGEYRIGESSVRRIVKAGNLLYGIRDGGEPLPLRPISETEFFYEGASTLAKFELGSDGQSVAMTLYPAAGMAGERAERIEKQNRER